MQLRTYRSQCASRSSTFVPAVETCVQFVSREQDAPGPREGLSPPELVSLTICDLLSARRADAGDIRKEIVCPFLLPGGCRNARRSNSSANKPKNISTRRAPPIHQ